MQVNHEAFMRKNEIYIRRKSGKELILQLYGGADVFPLLSYPVIDMTQKLPDPFGDEDVFARSFAVAMDGRAEEIVVHIERLIPTCYKDCKAWPDFMNAIALRGEKEQNANAATALAKIKETANSLYDKRAEYIRLPDDDDAILDFSRVIDPKKKRFYVEWALNTMDKENGQ
jgi:hypothetical protein